MFTLEIENMAYVYFKGCKYTESVKTSRQR